MSNSSGSDTLNGAANNCQTQTSPCKTVAAGLKQMRKGYPDHLYLKRGDTWRLGNNGDIYMLGTLPSGRSKDQPAVITYYPPVTSVNDGLGDRPRLQSNDVLLHLMDRDRIDFVHFIGLEFHAFKMDPKDSEFDGKSESSVILLGKHTNVLFEDNKFNFSELVLQSGPDARAEDLTVRRNIFTGSYHSTTSYENSYRPSNLYLDGAKNLTVEENVVDHGGWNATVPGAGANMYNHNMYIQYDVDGTTLVVRNNIITRASSHGVHGRKGGLFENNFFGRNAISLQMGYTNHPLVTGDAGNAINNVITEGHSMVKGDAACTDNATSNLCTGAIWGLHIDEPGAGVFLMKGNVIHSRSVTDTQWKEVFTRYPVGYEALSSHSGSAFTYQNNISWRWDNPNDSTGSYLDPGRTLADYNEYLGGNNSFEEFMDQVLQRSVGLWDTRKTAPAINDYIRAGFTAK